MHKQGLSSVLSIAHILFFRVFPFFFFVELKYLRAVKTEIIVTAVGAIFGKPNSIF